MSKHIGSTHDPALLHTGFIYTRLSRAFDDNTKQALMTTQQDSAVPFSTYTPRVAVVTGAGQGIGQAIALRLADDGIDIAVNDIQSKQNQMDNVVEQIRKKGRRAIGIPGDVTLEADIAALVEKAAQELGGVDIMVANAGIFQPSPLLETPTEKFDAMYAINIRGVFLCFKYAGLQMLRVPFWASKRQLIAQPIRLQSLQSAVLYNPPVCHPMELRKYGITVNAYAPGFINTKMLANASALDASMKKAAEVAPIGEPESIASIVSYIAKPESYFVNGQAISVNGGIYFD
ncbi:NAD-binding protein [Fomitiporia mediterranea MF3/22]|uniref:NAD-binding protein n=1 Tax=Fomitiporia mediterranea (strain MF3/22) TaxID=694068 RepID=UPI0004407AEE|nr:NAD-binding protein [Fomitiporia mediterranea MF3/22]EJD06784.1 NAD-binding protein [Fomitiporia mediterranea MF3/22]